MKNNIFGYLFFVFIIGIISFAIYKVNSGKENTETNTNDNSVYSSITEKGTTLTFGISEFDTINPIITKNRKVQDITKIVYDSLVNITEDGKVEAALAKEWETTDNLTYIVKLKSGIRWTDGTYFSSNDVKYTIDRLKETGESVYADNVKHVKEVDIIDNTTIRIILSRAVPFFQYYLNFPILSSGYYGNDNFWNTEKNDAPITTGQFEVSDVTNSTITLIKNNNWWNIENNESTIDKITLNLYSSVAELYNAFKLGSIDLLETTNGNYKEYIGTIGYNTAEVEGRKFAFLALNTKSPILSDVNVRKAIKNAINKDEITSKIYGKTYSRANFPLLNSSYLVDDKNQNSLNTSEIEKVLKSSGWVLRNGQWQKYVNYRTTKIELNLVVKKNSTRENVAEYIRENLAKQGIIVNVIKVSGADYKKYIEQKNYDILLAESTQSIAPDLSTFFAEGNLANYSNNEVKDIMKYINNITDEKELKSKYQKLYEKYNDDIPYIGIGRSKIFVVTNTYLSGEISSKWYNLFFKFKDWYTS